MPETLAWSTYSDPAHWWPPSVSGSSRGPGNTSVTQRSLATGAGYFAGRVAATSRWSSRATGTDELRAFLNVCRHRGCCRTGSRAARRSSARITPGRTASTARCARRRARREPGFELRGARLLPRRVDTWGPFVFVNPDPEADAARRHARVDARCSSPARRSTSTGSCSTTARESSVERELEDRLRELPRVLPLLGRAPRLRARSSTCRRRPTSLEPTAASRASRARARERYGAATRRRGARSQFHFLWPNTMINIFPGRANISIGPVLPAGPSGPSGSWTTSSAPASTRLDRRSCSPSTARLAPRTRCSSRTSSAASPLG